jgi:tellurite resistance protein TehA-like permease
MKYQLLQQFAQQIQINRNDICGSNGIPCRGVGGSSIQTALQVAFAIAGAVAVIIIIIAGLRYTISAGNPQEAAKAKNAILYAVIGVVVCVLGYGIVRFVINRI